MSAYTLQERYDCNTALLHARTKRMNELSEENAKLKAELDILYVEARRIAADFIGYPVDQEDERSIANATPLMAIKALEKRFQELRHV